MRQVERLLCGPQNSSTCRTVLAYVGEHVFMVENNDRCTQLGKVEKNLNPVVGTVLQSAGVLVPLGRGVVTVSVPAAGIHGVDVCSCLGDWQSCV